MIHEYIPQIIASSIAIILLPACKIISKKLVNKYGLLRNNIEARIKQTNHIISILLNVIFVITLAIIWGISPHNMLLGLSSVFALIGVAFFAQWSILSNVTAGIMMFFSAPFKLGDVIRIIYKDTPITATIEIIGTFYTHIRTEENELIVLPNNLFMQKIISVKKNDEWTGINL